MANFVGQVWRGLMGLVFVPFYLRILGIEAYGLVGLYASLQVALTLFDAGLRPTLAREMALHLGGKTSAFEARTILRSAEWPLFAIAISIAAAMFLIAPFVAENWIHPVELDPNVVIDSIRLMGFVAAVQLIESCYTSCLGGLQRQIVQNSIVTLIATLRGAGALAVLWIDPTITAFFAWQAIVSAISASILAFAVYRNFPPMEKVVSFSGNALRRIRPFALGMLSISLVAMLLSQLDRFLLAKFLPLAELGHYSLAASLAGTLAMVSMPLTAAFQPHMVELLARGDRDGFIAAFNWSSKLMTLVVGTAAATLAISNTTLLNLWLNDPEITAAVAPVLRILSIAVLFNTLLTLPYMAELAHGITSTAIKVNLVMLVLFVPSLVIAILRFGVVGAAYCALGMQFAGLVWRSTLAFKRLFIGASARRWVWDIVSKLVVLFGVTAVFDNSIEALNSPLTKIFFLLTGSVAACGVAIAIDPELRRQIAPIAKRLLFAETRNKL